MTSVFDVASYILDQQQRYMTTWKLQKLVYYCQAWSLVWDKEAIFPEEIEAWANGPVVRELYNAHRGKYRLRCLRQGDAGVLTRPQRATVNAVLKFYGNKPSQWLSDLTHMEDPWRKARKDLLPSERGNTIIPKEDLAEYYGSL